MVKKNKVYEFEFGVQVDAESEAEAEEQLLEMLDQHGTNIIWWECKRVVPKPNEVWLKGEGE